jgi:hypothetical protein
MTTLKLLRIEEGERRYRIPANVFPGIKCRSLNKMDRPESDPYNADFVINFTRINGRSKKVIKELGKYESMRLLTTFKVRSVFRRMCQKCGKEFVFIATHIHPAETC